MRITKRQLRRIIKEEKRKMLNEGGDFGELETDILLSVSSIEKGKTPMTPEEMQNMTVSFIDSALYTVQRKLAGLVHPEDFTTAVMRAAKEWA
jgi:hypothetical protein